MNKIERNKPLKHVEDIKILYMFNYLITETKYYTLSQLYRNLMTKEIDLTLIHGGQNDIDAMMRKEAERNLYLLITHAPARNHL